MSIPVANLQLFLQSNKSSAQKNAFLCNTWRNTVLQDCVWEDFMNSIDFLQIGHGQQSDARMVVERDVTDSQRIELAAVHRHLFYAVYWIHEGRGTHSIDFCDYEIRPDRIFLVRPELAEYAFLPLLSSHGGPLARRVPRPRHFFRQIAISLRKSWSFHEKLGNFE